MSILTASPQICKFFLGRDTMRVGLEAMSLVLAAMSLGLVTCAAELHTVRQG